MADAKVGADEVLDRPRDVCGYCNEKCTTRGKGSDGILCDYCGFWVHAKCDGMTAEYYKMFSKLAEGVKNLQYYCSLNHCNIVSKEILKQIGPIRQKVEENSQRIGVLEDIVSRNSVELETKVKEEVQNTVTETIEDKVKSVWEAEKDRLARAKNVLLANVPESEDTVGEQRKKHDEQVVSNLFTDSLGIDSIDIESKIVSVGRLGKKEDRTGKGPRLVRVALDQENTARKVLTAAPKLGEQVEERVRNIRIFRDMNEEDRRKRKALVDEMKQKNEDLRQQGITDSKWIIRGDKVIKGKANPRRNF